MAFRSLLAIVVVLFSLQPLIPAYALNATVSEPLPDVIQQSANRCYNPYITMPSGTVEKTKVLFAIPTIGLNIANSSGVTLTTPAQVSAFQAITALYPANPSPSSGALPLNGGVPVYNREVRQAKIGIYPNLVPICPSTADQRAAGSGRDLQSLNDLCQTQIVNDFKTEVTNKGTLNGVNLSSGLPGINGGVTINASDMTRMCKYWMMNASIPAIFPLTPNEITNVECLTYLNDSQNAFNNCIATVIPYFRKFAQDQVALQAPALPACTNKGVCSATTDTCTCDFNKCNVNLGGCSCSPACLPSCAGKGTCQDNATCGGDPASLYCDTSKGALSCTDTCYFKDKTGIFADNIIRPYVSQNYSFLLNSLDNASVPPANYTGAINAFTGFLRNSGACSTQTSQAAYESCVSSQIANLKSSVPDVPFNDLANQQALLLCVPDTNNPAYVNGVRWGIAQTNPANNYSNFMMSCRNNAEGQPGNPPLALLNKRPSDPREIGLVQFQQYYSSAKQLTYQTIALAITTAQSAMATRITTKRGTLLTSECDQFVNSVNNIIDPITGRSVVSISRSDCSSTFRNVIPTSPVDYNTLDASNAATYTTLSPDSETIFTNTHMTNFRKPYQDMIAWASKIKDNKQNRNNYCINTIKPIVDDKYRLIDLLPANRKTIVKSKFEQIFGTADNNKCLTNCNSKLDPNFVSLTAVNQNPTANIINGLQSNYQSCIDTENQVYNPDKIQELYSRSLEAGNIDASRATDSVQAAPKANVNTAPTGSSSAQTINSSTSSGTVGRRPSR